MDFELWKTSEIIRLNKLIYENKRCLEENRVKRDQLEQAMSLVKNYPLAHQILRKKMLKVDTNFFSQYVDYLELQVKRLQYPILICDEAKFKSVRKMLYQQYREAGIAEYKIQYAGAPIQGSAGEIYMDGLWRDNTDVFAYCEDGAFMIGYFVLGYFYFSPNLSDEEIEEHGEAIVEALSKLINEHAVLE